MNSKNFSTKYTINNLKSKHKILEIMENYSLVDTFRNLYPNLNHYTLRKPNSHKMARLDYFIVSNHLMVLILDTRIRYGHRSDHSVIELQIQLNKFQCSPEHRYFTEVF